MCDKSRSKGILPNWVQLFAPFSHSTSLDPINRESEENAIERGREASFQNFFPLSEETVVRRWARLDCAARRCRESLFLLDRVGALFQKDFHCRRDSRADTVVHKERAGKFLLAAAAFFPFSRQSLSLSPTSRQEGQGRKEGERPELASSSEAESTAAAATATTTSTPTSATAMASASTRPFFLFPPPLPRLRRLRRLVHARVGQQHVPPYTERAS